MTTTATYTREDLIAICEAASVPEEKWRNRDTSAAQRQLGEAHALLRAGCDFHVGGDSDDRTIWLWINFKGFGHFDWGGVDDEEHFYLPTRARLDARAGDDWY